MTDYRTMKVRAWTEVETREPKCKCGGVLVATEDGDIKVCAECGEWAKQPVKTKVTRRDRQRTNKDKSPTRNYIYIRVAPGIILIIDTETTNDIYQNLIFGAYLLAWVNPDTFEFYPFEEGLFYADDLPETSPDEYKILTEYVAKGRQRPNDGKLVAPKATDWPVWLHANYPDEFQKVYAKTLKGRDSFQRWLQQPSQQDWMNRRQAEYYSEEFRKVCSGVVALHEPDQIARWRNEWPHIQQLLNVCDIDAWQPDRWVGDNGVEHVWPNPPYSSRVSFGQVHEARMKHFMPRLPDTELKLMSATAFVNDVLYEVAFPKYSNASRKRAGESKPATIVTANGAFDFSRLAKAVKPGGPSGSTFADGFSMRLLPDNNEEVDLFESPKHGNNLRMVRRGARGTMFGFSDLERGTRDYFVDVLNLAWSLTNNIYSLDTVSRTFAKKYRKSPTPDFDAGITEYEVTYCRDDVFATADSYMGELRDVWKHPDAYDETKAHSPAALPKAYYSAMGIIPPLEKQPDFPRDVLGHAMTTFYAGRAEAHVRKVPVPIGYFDFTSMYPTVDINMGLWDYLTSERVEVIDETAEVQGLLDNITTNDLFKRETWLELRGIALLRPNEDILPVRTRFTGDTQTIATVYLTGKKEDDSLWWSIPDLVLSKLLTGKPPKITRAIRFYPSIKQQDGLKPVQLYGTIPVNPAKQDFFKVAMEQRQAVKTSIKINGHGVCECENIDGHKGNCQCGECHALCVCFKCSLTSSLKVTANSGSYGIFAEFNQEPNDSKQHRKDHKPPKVKVYGVDDEPVTVDTDKIDSPGRYSFPPIATLITSAARLMLGMLEKCVTDAGGTWAFCDTDSMAIVANETGDVIQTDTGPIPVLPLSVVSEIQARFDSLNPYDPGIAPGIHILKREHTDDPRQLYAYAVSAKRYALFWYKPDGSIEIVPAEGRKEHGLGAYLSPYNPNTNQVEKGSRRHVTEIWEYLISRNLGLPVSEPAFFDLPVMCKVTISTWNSFDLFKHFNGTCACDEHPAKPYTLQVKPYNFAMSPVVYTQSLTTSLIYDKHAPNRNGKSLRLIAPYNRDPAKWLDMEYLDTNDPSHEPYRITTERHPLDIMYSPDAAIRVMTWRDVAESFDTNPETKYCDQNGNTCGKHTHGVLQRHHIKIGYVSYIGKESNRLSDKDEPLPDLADYEIPDYGSGRDDVKELALPVLMSNGLSNRRIASLIRVDHETVNRYLRRDNLTRDLRADVQRVRDAIIKLAAVLALQDIPDSDKDVSWSRNSSLSEYCWEILITWKRARHFT